MLRAYLPHQTRADEPGKWFVSIDHYYFLVVPEMPKLSNVDRMRAFVKATKLGSGVEYHTRETLKYWTTIETVCAR